MKIKILILYLIFSTSFTSSARTGILDILISLEIKNTPLHNILSKIEEVGNVNFSYDPSLINDERLVSLSIKNKSIRFGLNLIFDSQIRFKEVGNYIVLLQSETKVERKTLEQTKSNYVFTGRIISSDNNQPVSNASVYHADTRIAGLTNENGYYTVVIPKSKSNHSFYFSKNGFSKQAIVLKAQTDSVRLKTIILDPLITKISLNDSILIPQSFEKKVIDGAFVSNETYNHNNNLSEIDEARLFQISLVPSVGIGSNLSTNGLVNNRISINILGGYAKGLYGVEIGGITNIIKQNVIGGQVGGICNLVGGNFTGLQVGGIFNSVKGDFMGLQIAGILNSTEGTITGAQLSTIKCAAKHKVKGLQISGISNYVADGFVGLQLSGIVNKSRGKSVGAQISGIYNVAIDEFEGGQFALFVNKAKKGKMYLQASIFKNRSNLNYGLQASYFVNHTQTNRGLQVGLVNVSKKGKGVAIGLVNIVKDGYRKVEVSANELTFFNASLKCGNQRLYNIYSFGYRPSEHPIFDIGFGFGSYININEKMTVSFDLTAHIAGKLNVIKPYFNFKFAPTVDFKIIKGITIFAGPSLTAGFVYSTNASETFKLPIIPAYEEPIQGGHGQLWFGARAGIRLF